MTDSATSNKLVLCACCGGSESIEIRFAACVATTHWRTIGPTGGLTTHTENDDIRRWQIPLCMNCLPKAYEIFLRNSLKKTVQHLKVCAIILLFGIPTFIGVAAIGSKSQLVLLAGTVYGGLLVVFMIAMLFNAVAWSINSGRLRKFDNSRVVPEERIDAAFWGEGQRIIVALLARGKPDSAVKVWGTFLLPQHVTGDSLEDTKKMLRESKNIIKKGTEIQVDAQLIAIVAVGRTIQEMEQRLPQEWKSVLEIASVHQAALEGNLDELRVSLKHRPKLVMSKGKNGVTPLHEAAANGHTDVAEFLLANDADVNARAKDDRTPLHEAACAGRSKVIELLLVKGADVNAKANNGSTALDVAGTAEVRALLAQGGTKP